MEAALRSRLLGLNLTNEVTWGMRVQGTPLPAITLIKVTPDRGYTMSGASGYHGESVQIDIWAPSYQIATAIRDAAVPMLEQPASIDGIMFDPAFLTAERAGTEAVSGVGNVSRISTDFLVWWQPAT